MSAAPTTAANLADYEWLVGGEGREWLERCAGRGSHSLTELATWLRRSLSAQQAHCILEQHTLRERAAARFPRAAEMFFRERALQQATDARSAAYKASRIPAGRPVLDLCCGLGGDLMALAARGPALGVDADPILACLAAANLQLVPATHCRVVVANANEQTWPNDMAIHLDPDRRPTGRRSVQLDHHAPTPWENPTWRENPAGLVVKLAPATDPNHPFLADAELEWIGQHRECQQLVAWFGPLATQPGYRCATRLSDDGSSHTYASRELASLELTNDVGEYVWEPAPSLLAAGLAANFAAEHDLRSLTAGGGYLTGDKQCRNGWAQTFRVLDIFPFRPKRLAELLKSHRIGPLEIKQRGTQQNLADLQRRFTQPDGEPATLLLYARGPKQIGILARRLNEPAQQHPGGGDP